MTDTQEMTPGEVHWINDNVGDLVLSYADWKSCGMPDNMRELNYKDERYMVCTTKRVDRDHYKLRVRRV